MTAVERLRAAEASLNRSIERAQPRFLIDGFAPDDRKSLATFVFHEFREIRTIVTMLARNVERWLIASERMENLHMTEPTGGPVTIPATSKRGQQLLEAMAVHDAEHSKLTVHFKTLYEWIYHLELLLKGDTRLRNLLDPELWRRLEAHCEFRHGLIAHKSKRKGYVIGMPGSSDYRRIRLVMNTWAPDPAVVAEMERLFRQCDSYLSSEEATRTNFYERCEILNARQHELSGDLLARVVAFIRKHGAASANVVELADFVAELAEDVLPQLP